MSDNRPIGFIDSGVGGLTVVKEALKQLPNESVAYLGDQARCPYGPRPHEEVLEFTWEMTRFLLKKNIKMLVIACNTATAIALEDIKAALDIPVVGVILPGSRAALKRTETHRIGVIGTEMTVKSLAYSQAMAQKSAKTAVHELACPKFVPLVESKQYRSSLAKMVVAESLKPLKQKGIDTLVLGCTHYPLLKPLVQNFMGDNVTLVDSGAETVGEVSMLLDYFDIAANEQTLPPEHHFYTTASPKMFEEIGKDWLPLPSLTVEKVVIVDN